MEHTGYENAPQTQLLATHCAVCARPLVDSVSVETGMGPICREKYGYNVDVDPESRKRANRIVWEIAMARGQRPSVELLNELEELGFDRLAEKLSDSMVTIRVEQHPYANGYLISTPYNPDTVSAWRRVPGRRWMMEEKANYVPASSKHKAWAILKAYFAGHTGRGPRGLFVI